MSSAEDNDPDAPTFFTSKPFADRARHRSSLKKARKPPKYETFNYDPLPKERGAIRLLKVEPSSPKNQDIVCELVPPKVNGSEPYRYDALSWCWGLDSKSHYIHIRKKGMIYAKYVSPNLHSALRALRHQVRDRYLWIDAICIDQDDLDEKNHQVEMMYEIYGNADRVCIWLGEENKSSRMALRFIDDEVLQLQKFDELCDSEDASKKWRALLELMQRPWFSRRWVVQEIALARKAVIYCGQDKISWKKFAIAVELFVEVETATHRLSEVMKKDTQYFDVPGWFEYISALGASLLVEATDRLFRDSKEERHTVYPKDEYESLDEAESSSDSDSSSESSTEATIAELTAMSNSQKQLGVTERNRVQPLLSLEYLVSSLSIFETTVPHDTIYALLAIAKDTTPRAARADAKQSSDHARDGLEVFTQRKRYNVDYKSPYVDVCKDFIQFSIERSLQNDRSRALDVICRPWATEEKVLASRRQAKEKEKEDLEKAKRKKARLEAKRHAMQVKQLPRDKVKEPPSRKGPNSGETAVSAGNLDRQDMPLPSWIPQLNRAPYGMYQHAGIAGPRMSRKNADPLVGLSSLTHNNYSAAETKKIDMKTLKFRKRSELGHFSLYVRGFQLDTIREVEQVARNGQIPKEWAELGDWADVERKSPPDAFWRTLVANRGSDGKNPPVYYSRACKECFAKGGFEGGAVNTTDLIHHERNSIVAQFCRRVQAVIWNRALVKTEGKRLGLVAKGVEKGDLVCILYGCSVPIILRRSARKEEEVLEREIQWERKFVTETIARCYKNYDARKKEHLKSKNKDMVRICRIWQKESNWLHLHGSSGIEELKETRSVLEQALQKLVKTAFEDYRAWYTNWREMKAQKEWEEIERKIEEENILQKQEKEKLARQRDVWCRNEEANMKKGALTAPSPPPLRNKSSTATLQVQSDVLDEDEDDATSEEVQQPATKLKPPFNWREFETQLRIGRRWIKIVKDLKKTTIKEALERGFKEGYDREARERRWTERASILGKCPLFEAVKSDTVDQTASVNIMGDPVHDSMDYNAQSHTPRSRDPEPGLKQGESERKSFGTEIAEEEPGDIRLINVDTTLSELLRGENAPDTDDDTNTNLLGETIYESQSNDAAQSTANGTNSNRILVLNSHVISDNNPIVPLSQPTSGTNGTSGANHTTTDPSLEHKLQPILPHPLSSAQSARLNPREKLEYDWAIQHNLRERLGDEAYYSYTLLSECYIHGMMDGEAMLYQNEGKKRVIPSKVFEIR